MKTYNKAISTGLKLWVIKAFSCPFSWLCFFKTDLFREGNPTARQGKGTFDSKTETETFPFPQCTCPCVPTRKCLLPCVTADLLPVFF